MDEIEPGKRVGEFVLGKDENELADLLTGFIKREDKNFIIYKNKDMDVLFSKNSKKLYEVAVHSNFKGSYERVIRIGNNMENIIRNFGECSNDFDDYYSIKKYKSKDYEYGILLMFSENSLKGKIIEICIYNELYD